MKSYCTLRRTGRQKDGKQNWGPKDKKKVNMRSDKRGTQRKQKYK